MKNKIELYGRDLAVRYAGNVEKLAKFLNVKPTTVYSWPEDEVPYAYVLPLILGSNGELTKERLRPHTNWEKFKGKLL